MSNIVSATYLCYHGCERDGDYGAMLFPHVPVVSFRVMCLDLCFLSFILFSLHEFWDLSDIMLCVVFNFLFLYFSGSQLGNSRSQIVAILANFVMVRYPREY